MVDSAKILVIDDEHVICLGCKKTLESEGMNVDCVENGLLGIAKLNEKDYHIVLLDLMMPALRGMEVLSAIERMDKAIVPIIITGYATMESSIRTLNKGAFAFLPKPFTSEELRKVVYRAIEHRKKLIEKKSKNEVNEC
ncbi:response regulator [candidate division KSB1 bacterium]|nr:response regulator [candidate division KSB1 bacterium]